MDTGANSVEEGIAAQHTAADADSAENLRLIAHTDLPQFNPHLKHCRQIFYELTEIDPSVRRKIEEHFVVVKGIFCVDQFRIEPVPADLFHWQMRIASFSLAPFF